MQQKMGRKLSLDNNENLDSKEDFVDVSNADEKALKTKLGNQSLINFENADSKEEYLDNINAEEGLKNKMFKLDSRLSS